MMMKSTKITYFLAAMLLGTAAYAVTPSITVGTASGQPNTSVDVSVAFENTAGGDVVAFQLDINFNGTNLTADVTNCGLNLPAITCSAAASKVTIVGDGSLQTIASGSLGSIAFAIANNNALIGTSEALTISGQLFSDDQGNPVAAGTMTNGSISITAAPAPAITVAPDPGTFSAAIGSSDDEVFTITNSGNADGLLVSGVIVSNEAGSEAFGLVDGTNTCPSVAPGLAQGATCTVTVRFTPAVLGAKTASLAITSNAGNKNITLNGTGTAGPAGALTITPAPYNYGNVLTNSETPTQSFTVTNTGAAGSSVDISTITVAAPFGIAGTGNTCATADLAKDETCTVSVTFTPTADGAAAGTLSVSGIDGNGDTKTATSALSGTGVTEARPTADPASGTTESEVVGPEGSFDFTVLFGNEGNQSFDVACSLTSGDNTIWTVTGGASTTVDAGATHTVTTTCTLPDTETYEATVSCSIGQQTYTYNYECVGLPPLPVPVDNKWALALLALMMLMAASFGFRFIARQ